MHAAVHGRGLAAAVGVVAGAILDQAPVVAGEEDQRILVQVVLLELGQHLADGVIRRDQRGGEILAFPVCSILRQGFGNPVQVALGRFFHRVMDGQRREVQEKRPLLVAFHEVGHHVALVIGLVAAVGADIGGPFAFACPAFVVFRHGRTRATSMKPRSSGP